MDRQSLREYLDAEGVHRDAYDLNGRGIEDRLSLDLSDGGYRILYTERGRSSVFREFADEDGACRFLADELMRHESYRFAVVAASVHRGVSAKEYLEHWLGANGLTLSEITDDDFRIAYPPDRSGGAVIQLSVRRTYLLAHGLLS